MVHICSCSSRPWCAFLFQHSLLLFLIYSAEKRNISTIFYSNHHSTKHYLVEIQVILWCGQHIQLARGLSAWLDIDLPQCSPEGGGPLGSRSPAWCTTSPGRCPAPASSSSASTSASDEVRAVAADMCSATRRRQVARIEGVVPLSQMYS
jgi:hypothetical protein